MDFGLYTGLELHSGHRGQDLHCPWYWPWCPFKCFQLTFRYSNGSALSKMKMCCPFKDELPGLCIKMVAELCEQDVCAV